MWGEAATRFWDGKEMSRRSLRIAIPVAVAGLVAAQLGAPLRAAVAAGATTTTPTATASHGGAMSGAMIAQALRPQLQRRAAAGDFPTAVKASGVAPSGGSISPNLHFLSNLPLPSAISVAFIGDVAFVSTVLGLFSVDISDPSNPTLLGSVPQYIWENEHMTVDPARHLLFLSRDPRGFTTPATTAFPYGALQIYDVSNPALMKQIAFHLQPTGHTATCINNCQDIWIAGPASPAVAVQGGADPTWGGRPLWGENLSDPANPADCKGFLDLNNHNGATDYDHDIDVDANGVAWVSGSGHIHGYWTSGQHLDPVTGKVENATACKPVPYAGANTNEGQLKVQGGVIHNSGHDLAQGVDGRLGDVLTATEEVTGTTDCAQTGRFLTYDLAGTYHGEGWTAKTATLKRLGVWTPQNQAGSSGCDSAHWFTVRGDGLIAIAFYGQGTRLLDVTDPRHITQVGWYNPSGNETWAAYWHGSNEIVVADFARGLDILHYDGALAASSSSRATSSGVSGANTTGQTRADAAVTTLPNTGGGGETGAAAGLALVGVSALAVATRRRNRYHSPTQTPPL